MANTSAKWLSHGVGAHRLGRLVRGRFGSHGCVGFVRSDAWGPSRVGVRWVRSVSRTRAALAQSIDRLTDLGDEQ
jgi:hypothetical protein